jgi:uncharacterized membrane protein YdjX (TVP38/TMEM64 family)
MLKRFLPLIVILAVAAILYASGLYQQLSLAALRDHERELRDFVGGHYLVAVAVFVALSATVIAASVPVGLFLTVAGGFILGPWVAGAALSFAATLGATGSYVAVRSAFGDALRRRAERKDGVLKKLMDEIARHTFSTVLTLRLIPLVPFWLVNAAAGLTRAPMSAFVAGTALGVLPETFIYSHIGAGLGRVFARTANPTLTDLVDPGLIWALAALAVLSIVGALIARRRRVTLAR